MRDSLFRAACVVLLSACGKTPPPEKPDTSALVTITDAYAGRFSAPDLIRMYVVDGEGAAVYLTSRECPAQSARVDSLLTGLLDLAPSADHTRDYALSWPKLMSHCREPRVASWYRDAIGKPQDDLTAELLTKSLLRVRDSLNINAVKKAAFDTANHPDARSAMLSLFVEELYFSGEQRVELMIESYRQTGEVPGSFAADQAGRLWVLGTSHWREDLLAQVVADPGRRGAAPLLLTLARETRRAPTESRWRKVWDTALDVLGRHPEASADLKTMIPIAREVSQYQKK